MVSNRHGQFLFINKTGTSLNLSRSLADEKAAIQSHVQTGRKRNRPSKRKSATPGLLYVLPTGGNANSTWMREAEDEAASSAVEQHLEMAFVSPELLSAPAAAIHLSRSMQSPLAVSLGRSEPFDASSVPVNKTIHGLLHYYIHYYHPTLWPNEMIMLKHGIYVFHNAVQNILRNAIASPLVMYCLLSASICRLHHIDRLPAAAEPARESLYICKATGLLASHLRDYQLGGDLLQNLLCVMFLLSAESYRDSLPAAEIHMQAAKHLVEPIGGLSALPDESLQNQVAMGDLFLACVHMRPCMFEPFYDPGPASVLGLQASELLPQPQRLRRMIDSFPLATETVTSDLLCLIKQLAESYSIKCRINAASMPAKRVYTITRWMTTRNMAIRNHLLGLPLLNRAADIIRVAVIMWSLLVMNVTGRTKTVKLMAPRLQSLVANMNSKGSARTMDWKLWILLVGQQCAAKNSECSDAFTAQISKDYGSLLAASGPRFETITQLRQLSERLQDFQESYFFDEDIQQSRMFVLAQRLLCSNCHIRCSERPETFSQLQSN